MEDVLTMEIDPSYRKESSINITWFIKLQLERQL